MKEDAQFPDSEVQVARERAVHLMKCGHPDQQVRVKLIREGVSEELARMVVKDLSAQRRLAAKKAAAKKTMAIGYALFGVGIIITLVSYAAAGNRGIYVVASGAIMGGAIQFGRGLWMLL